MPFGAKLCANHVSENSRQFDMDQEIHFTKNQLDLISLFYCSSQDTENAG